MFHLLAFDLPCITQDPQEGSRRDRWQLMGQGASLSEIAAMLGDSEAIVEPL